MSYLGWIKKNLIIVIPIVMVLGLLFGINVNASFLKAGIVPLTFLMVYPMMVNLQIKKIFEGGDTKVQLTTQLINFGVTPFIAYGFGVWFFPDNHYLALGLLLTGLLPTSGMTISWTGMARGNMPAAVKMTVFGLFIGSLLTPFYVKWLMGTTVDINMVKVFKQVGIIVVLPLILGNVTRRLLVARYGLAHYSEKLKMKFPPFSTLGVVGIVFVAMALKAKGIMAHPAILLTILVPLVLFYGINIIMGIVVGKLFFERGNAIALLYGTVMRNLSIALAIAMTAFGKEGADIALVIALGYIIQVQLAAWVVKLTDRIYGSAPEDEAGQIMHLGLFALHTTDSLHSAVKLLAEENIHSLAVLDAAEQVKGILTLKQVIDLVADELAMDTSLAKLQLESAVLVNIHQPVSEVVKTMKRQHEYKVLITDDKGKIQGVVTAHDVMNDLI
ncbi:MAG: bile acid:sodium symporter [Victivallaceae bacterium]|nr:bile acid:sodium symporter [Victivallaceae bacterium]